MPSISEIACFIAGFFSAFFLLMGLAMFFCNIKDKDTEL